METVTQETNGKSAARAPATNLELDVGLIDSSPTQPRRNFDPVLLQELADDIKVHGVLQDVLARPSPKKKGRFELVFGERRVRASRLAGLQMIPAKVRNLTDAEVIEIQIVENAKRSDIHPLEEADAYEALHKKHGYSIEEIAAKVAKSTATIYARLKFCTLTEGARKAFLEGKLDAAKALLLARIPHEDLQKKALAEITKVDSYRKEAPSFREAQEIVRKNFMLRLVDAPFDRADAKLVEGTPACSACPKRTGNQRELFSDLETKDDLCTDTKCFKQKTDAAWAKKTEEAKAQGVKVLADSEAKKVFGHGGHINYQQPYVDLDAETWVNGKNKSNRSLLGKVDVPVILARDADGRPRELVDEKAFNSLRRKAEKTRAKEGKQSAAEVKAAKANEADRKREQREKDARVAKIVAIVSAAERRQPNDAFWRLLAVEVARINYFEVDRLLDRRAFIDEKSEDLEKTFREMLAKMTGAQARGVVVELLFQDTYESKSLDAFAAFYGAAKTKPAAKKAPKAKTKKKR